jgi:hypothetical protein
MTSRFSSTCFWMFSHPFPLFSSVLLPKTDAAPAAEAAPAEAEAAPAEAAAEAAPAEAEAAPAEAAAEAAPAAE